MKLSNSTRRADAAIAILMALSIFPYENGPMAEAIPPVIKPWVAFASMAATWFLAEWKIKQTEAITHRAPAKRKTAKRKTPKK